MPVSGATEGAAVPGARQLRADACRNHERLLVAAAQSFAEKGAEAPLEDIARRAEVGIGTLYRHFPTRDALVEAVYRHEVELLCAGATELLETLAPDEALAAWMQRFVAHVATKRGMATALKSMLGARANLFDECRARVVDTADGLLAAGVAAGSLRADIAGTDLLRAMSGICMSADQGDWQPQAIRLVGLLADGLRFGVAPPALPARA